MASTNQQALSVLRAQCGDRDALEELLRHVQPSLRRCLRAIVGASDADDVLQDVLVQIYRKLNGLQAPEAFQSWAFRIATNAGLRHAKTRQRRQEQVEDLDPPPDVIDPQPPPDAARLDEFLAAHQVSPLSSAVLTLHFQEDMTLAEVAAVLDVPLGTVKSRLAYGVARLRERLGNRRNT